MSITQRAFDLEESAGGPPVRLFFALLPPEELRHAIGGTVAEAVRQGGGTAIPVANLHITLAFLGWVLAERLPRIGAIADAVRSPPFLLRLDRIDLWPSGGVLLLDAISPVYELAQLVMRIHLPLRSAGFQVQPRSFHLHMTLARNVGKRRQVDPALRLPVQLEKPLVWPVEDFALVLSQRGRTHSVYQTLGSWFLRQ